MEEQKRLGEGRFQRWVPLSLCPDFTAEDYGGNVLSQSTWKEGMGSPTPLVSKCFVQRRRNGGTRDVVGNKGKTEMWIKLKVLITCSPRTNT